MPIKIGPPALEPELRVSQEAKEVVGATSFEGHDWVACPGGPLAVAPPGRRLANWPGRFGEQEAFHHYLAVGLCG